MRRRILPFLRRHHRSLATVVGVALVVAGVALVALPVALIVAGVALVVLVGIDFGGRS
jgi:uncharacterized membrane protein HdeD (DUF308 family)